MTASIVSQTTKRRRLLKAQGICGICMNQPATTDSVCCQSCREKSANYNRRRRDEFLSQGLCGVCGKETFLASMAENRTYRLCETCYLKKTSRMRLGSEEFWRIIKGKLEAQYYQCAYTGRTLILATNDSLDHIHPVKHYPHLKNDPHNVEWVCREINEMKRDRTPEQFLSLMQDVLNHTRGLRVLGLTCPVRECVPKEAVCFS